MGDPRISTGARGRSMIPARVIEAKRDGRPLAPEEMEAFFRGHLRGEVTDYQVAALLMAIVFRGLAPDELDALTRVMLESGARLVLDDLDGPRVDKHSTGGVGDKVSLVLAPLAAELGIYVPMMSGRGLGHTGGTLDKLEAIPGFRTDLSLEAFRRVLGRVGCAMIGQTPEIAPLDGKLYALRSATGTVPSLPLIASSIMSKKLAEGLTGLVLDVKVGEGAFLSDEPRALDLARTMVRLGEAHGVRTVALATAMDRPLGRAVGNALETAEAVACLRGSGPPDLREVVLALAAEMAVVADVAVDADEGRARAEAALGGGGALERFRRMVEAQGGDPAVADAPGDVLPGAQRRAVLEAPCAGVVEAIVPSTLGWAVVALGGGRRRAGDTIDPAVGFVLEVAPGDRVAAGDPLVRVHAADEAGVEEGLAAAREAVRVGEREASLRPLLGPRVTAEGVEPL